MRKKVDGRDMPRPYIRFSMLQLFRRVHSSLCRRGEACLARLHKTSIVLWLIYAYPLHAAPSAEPWFEAHLLGGPTPNLSTLHPGATLTDAYAIQKQLSSLQQPVDTLLGVALEATDPTTAPKWHIDIREPLIIAVWGRETQTSGVLSPANPHTGILEPKLGFYLNTSIQEPIKTLAELKTKLASVIPVVEYTELKFQSTPTLIDLIASNGGAHKRWIGAKTAVNQNIDSLEVITRYNQHPLYAGQGRHSLGSQWVSLQQLINRSLAAGETITPQTLLITGSLTTPISPKAGQYDFEFGGLGVLTLKVSE